MDREGRRSRRRFLSSAAGALALGAGCGGREASGTATTRAGTAPTTETRTDGPRSGVGVERVASGFVAPTDIAVGDGVLVADQPGQVYRAGDDEPVVDLSTRLVARESGRDPRGLLAVAVHPADGTRLFVRYSAPPPDDAVGYSHTAVLAAVRLDAAAPADTERVLLSVAQPQANNNGRALSFGSEGHLYVGLGDGGGEGDVGRGHAEDWYERVRGGNGQDVESNRLGSLLRIDVDAGERGRYAVPPDNPLVGADGFDEQYAWGFRDPRGVAVVDGAPVVADAGQARFEEVNVVERGGNYGWNVREGPGCFDPTAPAQEPAGCPSHTLAGESLLDPALTYPHPEVAREGAIAGERIVGGRPYEGAIGDLDGRYVFADRRARGRLFVADPAEGWRLSTVTVRGDIGRYVRAVGGDEDAYVLTVDRLDRQGSTGVLWRLRP